MKIPDDHVDRIDNRGHEVTTVAWSHTCECSFLLTVEAYRRFLELTQDPRQAAGLTLAWASIEGGERARPDL